MNPQTWDDLTTKEKVAAMFIKLRKINNKLNEGNCGKQCTCLHQTACTLALVLTQTSHVDYWKHYAQRFQKFSCTRVGNVNTNNVKE